MDPTPLVFGQWVILARTLLRHGEGVVEIARHIRQQYAAQATPEFMQSLQVLELSGQDIVTIGKAFLGPVEANLAIYEALGAGWEDLEDTAP